MSRAAAKATPAKLITSTRQLAIALGVSHVAVAGYLKHDEWLFGSGPWSADRIPLMKQWQADTLRPANERQEESKPGGKESVSTTVKRLQGLLIKEKIEGEKIENAKKRGEVVNREEFVARHLQVLELVKRNMLAMPARLPFDDAIKSVVRDHVRQVFETITTLAK